MQNQTAEVALRSFQQKLDTFKTKIALQQFLAQSLLAEFESLSSDVESLKRLLDASLQKNGSTSSEFGVTSIDNESTSLNIGATSCNFESSSSNFGSSSSNFGSSSSGFGSSSSGFGSSSSNDGATFIKPEPPSQNDGASSPIRELSALIRRSARESLKIYYNQPNIPGRMAEIVLALKEKKRLSVAEMRQITGVSRNSLGRDIKVLKLLGWLEFHGSRKNGYFTLTALFPGLSNPEGKQVS